jgi:hypothetical protein
MPYQNEIAQMLYGSLANRLSKSDPKFSKAFGEGGAQHGQYSGMFGDQPVQQYTGFGRVPSSGITSQAMQGIYGKPAGQSSQAGQAQGSGKSGSSPRMSMQGSGAYSAGTTGEAAPMATPTYNPAAYQHQNLAPVQANQQQYDLAKQVGTNTINTASRQAQGDLMRTMGARGMGQSGLAMKAAGDLYNRGAGQQAAQLGQQLSSQNLGNIYTSGLQSQNLGVQQAGTEATLGQAEAGKRADLELQNRSGNLQTALGLGNLGIAERGQGLQELTAQRSWEDAPLTALSGLGAAAMANASNQQGGKGGGK